jgi:DNA-binding LacI/PurR family transcriptional regulator
MGSEDATIYEVARRSGVSISTVSLAINHPERVRGVTRDKILTVADEIGFVPKENAIARAKAGVGRIAVVAPFTSYPSFARRLDGVLREIGDDGTQVLVYDHEDIAFASSPLLGSLPIRGHVDGLIIMAVPIDDKITSRLRGRMPTVLVDMRHEGLSSVYVDDRAGGRMVGERLLALGHQRVAYIRETETSYRADAPTQLRSDGLAAAIGRSNFFELTVSRTAAAGREAMDQLFPDGGDPADEPTALFAHGDLVAFALLKAAAERGLRVPADLTIVGFDDGPVAEAIGLTTVSNPFEESGRRAVELLRARIADAHYPVREVVLPLSLAERSTSGPVRSTLVNISQH